MTSPYEATGTTIALYGVAEDATTDHWGAATAVWGGASVLWSGPAWQDVSCDVLALSWGWGVDSSEGAVAIPAAGQWAIDVYDPDRSLDPQNGASPLRNLLVPGTPIRVLSPAGNQLGESFLDYIEHTEGAATGRIEAIDGIGLIAQATTSDTFEPFLPGQAWTLSAFITAILADTNLADDVPLGANIPAPGSTYDPLIAPVETANQNAWQLIANAVQDALQYVYVDHLGALQLAEYGFIVDSGTILGDGGVCLTDVTFARTAAGIVNVVNDGAGLIRVSGSSVRRYGASAFSVDRREPGGDVWGAAILADRAQATRVILPVDLLPVGDIDLMKLRDTKGKGVRVKVDASAINQYGQAVGGSYAVQGGGVWTASLRVYQPASTYDYNPPSPFANARPTVYRRASCTGATYLFTTPTNVHGRQEDDNWTLWAQGASLAAGQPEANRRARILLDTPFDWNGVRRLIAATLHISFVVATTLDLSILRILGEWSPDATEWPGPTVDAVNRITVPPTAGSWQTVDISPLVWMMAPQSLGGYGLPNLGMEIRQEDETVLSAAQFADYGRGDDLGPWVELTVWEE